MEDGQMTTENLNQHTLENNLPTTDSSFIELTNTQEGATQDYTALENHASLLEIMQGIQALLAEMESIRRDFDAKVKYDESKERVIESLHRELLLHQEGLHFRVLRPVFMDLITLYDDIDKFISSINDGSVYISEPVMQHLITFQESIEEILRNNGVESFIVEEDIFLPARQRSLRVISTSDPAQDKHIVRRVRQGFEYEGKLLRHEIVEVYKYTAVSHE